MVEQAKAGEQSPAEADQEVSKSHSTKRRPFMRNPNCAAPIGKERTQALPLSGGYVAGFIDGEGSFYIGINTQKTTRSGIEIRPQFSIELRADDRNILERIMVTIGCGKVYDCSYDRYGWFPHAKYKISSVKQIAESLIPFLDKYPLQAKKASTYRLFREVVFMVCRKEHLTEAGALKIRKLREEMRKNGKKQKMGAARIRENRSFGGMGHTKMIPIPPVNSEELTVPEDPALAGATVRSVIRSKS